MNILFGLTRPDSGSISIDGSKVRVTSPRAAQRFGIGMVHQHFALVPTLSVLDNIALALDPGLGLVRRGRWTRRIREIAERLHWKIDVHALMRSLSVGQQQRIEIVKALLGGGRLLVLDEPTAVLTPQEVDELFPALRALASSGTAIVFISHKLAEIEKLCDTVSVLRRGKLVHSGPLAGLTRARIAELMIGDAPPIISDPITRRAVEGTKCLEVSAVDVRSDDAASLVENATFSVHGGEIVGIAGVDGNGQAPLIDAIIGVRAITEGRIRFADGAARCAIIPEDRQRQALVLPLSVRDNVMLAEHRHPPFSRHGWLCLRAWDDHARKLVRDFDVRTPSITTPVAALSGGNQQKVVVAREMHGDPGLIVAVNPTRGLDIGASAFVMNRLIAARARGAGILLVHSDLDELLALSDRILVMFSGRIVDSGWPRSDRAAIGRLMLGLPASAA